MEYVLGVDGGGSRTKARICDINGRLLSESIGGPTNYKKIGIDKTISNITNAVLGAIEKIDINNEIFFISSCFGLSGIDCSKDLEIYRRIIINSNIKDYLNLMKLIICNDSRIGLAAGTENKNAILVICGTGSICYGINEKGEESRVNGWDYLLGDQGSGVSIGIKALKSIMKAFDGRINGTLLSEAILKILKLDTPYDLIKWVYNNPEVIGEIANLSKTVCLTAEKGDPESIRILKEESDEVFESILAIARKLDLMDSEFDLLFVGSVFKCKKYFKEYLLKKLINRLPGINIKPLIGEPVFGAIKLSLKNI